MSDADGTGAADDVAQGDGTPANDGSPVVTVEDLGHAFGDVTVFEGVSVELRAGTVTALVGPNGSGKTTLLRVVAGLLDPTAGTVSVAADADRPVGYLPQQPGFRPAFTVRETLAFYADLVGDDAVDERLATVGLSGVADRRVAALSGGMVRLLAVAQATVGDPPVLVLDEPTSGLDPAMTDRVFGAVRRLAAGGRAVLLASHDLAAVERDADEVLVLDRGAVEARGSPADLRARTGTDSLSGAFPALVRRDDDEPAVRAGRRTTDGAGGGDR